MKRGVAVLVLILWALSAWAEAEPSEALYFYQEYCESCDPEGECLELLAHYTDRPATDFRVTGYNLIEEESRQALERICAERDRDADKVLLPLLVLDGVWYEGSQAMNYDLPQYGVSASDGMETVIYELAMPACEACMEAEKLLSALPESVEVKLGRYLFSSPVRVIRVDISAEPALALALFDAWGVPEEERIAPLALAGEDYYRGVESIDWLIRYHLKNGDSLHTSIVTVEKEQPATSVTIWASALAGLTAGFNPCALSMLLLFLGLMLNLRRSVIGCAVLFLGSKFVCYLLIGTVLLGVLREVELTWLASATKMLMTILAVPLIVLNLRDAWMAWKQRYGEIRNQLPSRMRGWLNRTIERINQVSGGWFLPAVAVLGFMVAAGEFLCAGQIYLAAILSLTASGALIGMGCLVIYCVSFMVPSIVVTVFIARGTRKFAVADGLRRYMPAIKIVSAVFLAAALVWAWL